jgi:hypothetical protein
MARLFLLLALVMFPCRSLMLVEPDGHETNSGAADTLLYTFNSPECSNPCWLGIELGVTDKETTIAILQEHDIEYTLEGYSGDSIWLHHIPGGLFPQVAPEQFTRGGINLGTDGIVTLMNFDLDLCVSTLISTYGEPSVWDGILVYSDHQLFFGINTTTQRIDGVYLHLKDAMPSPVELQDWTQYAGAFSSDCSDIFTE